MEVSLHLWGRVEDRRALFSVIVLADERKYIKILIVYVVYSYKYVSVPLTLTH
jgi:hypothetical protein